MPFSEQRLSDFLTFYLNREWRGGSIIINREVEIQNRCPSGIGERADIMIQTTTSQDGFGKPQPCVVVEVKVDKNVKPEDIPVQLVGKYLDGDSRTCGIYLVAWYGKSRSSVESIRAKSDQIARNSCTDSIRVSAKVLDLSHSLNEDK